MDSTTYAPYTAGQLEDLPTFKFLSWRGLNPTRWGAELLQDFYLLATGASFIVDDVNV